MIVMHEFCCMIFGRCCVHRAEAHSPLHMCLLPISGGEGHSIFYTGFLDSTHTNGVHPRAEAPAVGATSPTGGSTTLPAK